MDPCRLYALHLCFDLRASPVPRLCHVAESFRFYGLDTKKSRTDGCVMLQHAQHLGIVMKPKRKLRKAPGPFAAREFPHVAEKSERRFPLRLQASAFRRVAARPHKGQRRLNEVISAP